MHYYKITDPVEIRIMVLFTLKMATESLSRAQVNHCILSSCDCDMFDVCDAMAYLEDVGEVYRYHTTAEREALGLTDSGKISADNFGDDLPLLIRETIVETIKSMRTFEKNAKRVQAETVAVNFEEFSSHMQLTEEGVKLMDLTMFAGDEESARKMSRNYRNRHAELYNTILKILTREDEVSE